MKNFNVFNQNLLNLLIITQFIEEGGADRYGNDVIEVASEFQKKLTPLLAEPQQEKYGKLIDAKGMLNTSGLQLAHGLLNTRPQKPDFKKLARNSFASACAMTFIGAETMEEFTSKGILTDANGPIPLTPLLKDSLIDASGYMDGLLEEHASPEEQSELVTEQPSVIQEEVSSTKDELQIAE